MLVPVSAKGIITSDHERWIEQQSQQDSYLFQRFYSQLLRHN